MRRRLYIAARAPRPGSVKTRLGRTIGHEYAAALYGAFLSDLSARFAPAPFPVAWYVTPAGGWCESLAGDVLAQPEGDWTERQRALFRSAAARGEQQVVLVASDSPHVAVDAVSAAFEALERHELVLGPVLDGGYYLIGMRGWHDVLAGVAMSTASVFDEVLAAARGLDLSTAELAATFDVDEAEDLAPLEDEAQSRSDLSATRAALAAIAGRARVAA